MRTATVPIAGHVASPVRWILLVLLLMATTAGMDLLHFAVVNEAIGRAHFPARPGAVPLVYAVGYVGAGWLADRAGPRRVVGLSLCAYATVAAWGAVADTPAAVEAVHWGMSACYAAFWTAAVAAVALAVPPGWGALCLAAVYLAGRLSLVGFLPLALAVYRLESVDGAFGLEFGRPMFFLLAATGGALAAALWLCSTRGGDPAPTLSRVASPTGSVIRRLAWLAMADLGGTVAFRILEGRGGSFVSSRLALSAVDPGRLNMRLGIAFAAALLGASAWSDWQVRSGTAGADARRALIVGGLLAAGLLAIVPAVHDPQALALLLFGATAGLGAACLTLPALVGASTRGWVGRVVGLSAAVDTIVTFHSDRLVAAFAPAGLGQGPFFVWAGLAALAGAGAAAAAFRPSRPRP